MEDPVEALRQIVEYGKANKYRITKHAWEEMENDNVSEQDVAHGLISARGCTFQPDHDTWRVRTIDLDGLNLILCVRIDDGVIVVTVFT